MPYFSLADAFSAAGFAAFLQVIAIDLLLAGDNVVVLGTLATGLPAHERRRVLAIGVGIALVARIVFALVATQLLQVVGLVLAGGLLLLWVAWRLFRDLRAGEASRADAATPVRGRSFRQAVVQVALADLSMSLDNVLAVAGASREHPTVLLFGLALSVALMAVAANAIARLIERYRWLAYLGLLVVLYVAGSMIHQGWVDPAVGIGHLLT